MKEYDIILTADRSIMNEFHKNWRLCTLTWASTDWIPPKVFNLFSKRPRHKNGQPIHAPLSLRSLEATLLDRGYKVKVVIPEYLDRYLPRTKALGISTQDPMGEAFSPVFVHTFCAGHKISKTLFQRLVGMSAVQKARRKGVKVIVGGPGTWQLSNGFEGVDCIVGGESERILPELLDRIRAGERLPGTIDCQGDLIPGPKDVSPIRHPTQSGLLQVGRGCPRRCKFCTVSGKPYWFPLDFLEREAKVNARSGLEHVQLVSEDLLLYGSNSIVPRLDRFNKLISMMACYCRFISLSHFSISAILQEPRLFKEIHHHWPETQRFAVAQAGIETGSERVLKKISPAKKAPFKDRDWFDMVVDAVDIMEDSKVFPYYTVLIGGPFETASDVLKTLELLDEVQDRKSILMPCLYTTNERAHPEVKDLKEMEKQVIRMCLKHNLKWYKWLSDKVVDMTPSNRFIKSTFRDLMHYWVYRRLRDQFKRNECDIDKEEFPYKKVPMPLQATPHAHQDSI